MSRANCFNINTTFYKLLEHHNDPSWFSDATYKYEIHNLLKANVYNHQRLGKVYQDGCKTDVMRTNP